MACSPVTYAKPGIVSAIVAGIRGHTGRIRHTALKTNSPPIDTRSVKIMIKTNCSKFSSRARGNHRADQ